MKTALVASATDPSGLSGLAQDVRVMHCAGVHAAVVVTGITAQGRKGVSTVKPATPRLIASQWDGALPLLSSPRVTKVGLVPSLPAARALGRLIRASGTAAIVDTPFSASWGGRLTATDPVRIYLELLPYAELVTPNVDEAAAMAGVRVRDEMEMLEAAELLIARGAGAVLVKGGHLKGALVDVLATPEAVMRFPHARSGKKPRGTGCALSSLIAARMAQGLTVQKAVESAEREFPLGLMGVKVAKGALAYDASALTDGQR